MSLIVLLVVSAVLFVYAVGAWVVMLAGTIGAPIDEAIEWGRTFKIALFWPYYLVAGVPA